MAVSPASGPDRGVRRRRLPVVAGFAQFGGFAVLAVLWFTRGVWWPAPPADLPGLFDFPSAYIGDSLLLPVAVALMLLGAGRLPRARRDRMVAAVFATVAGLLAAGVQFLWLADDHPRGNWTFPQPHRFNVAGVWHAGYFSVTAAGLMLALVLFGYRTSAALRSGERGAVLAVLRGAGPSVVLSCLLAYVVLVARDSSASTFASRSSLLSLGVAVAVFVVFTVAVLRRSIGLLAPHLVLAVFAATAVTVAVDAPWSGDRTQILGEVSSGLVGVGIGLLTLVPGRGKALEAEEYLRYRPHPVQMPLVGGILATLLPALWVHASAGVAGSKWLEAGFWVLCYLVAVVVVCGSVVRGTRLLWVRQATDVMVVSLLFCVIGLVALTVPRWRQASDAAPLSSLLVAIVISALLFPILKIRMHIEIRDEQGPPDDESGSFGLAGAAKTSATATVGMLLVFGLAGVVSLLGFTLAAAVDRKYVADSGMMPQAWRLLGAGAALISVAVVLLRFKSRRPAKPFRFAAAVLTVAWPIIVVAVAGVHEVAPVAWVAVAGGGLLALWSANTMVNNVGTLRGTRVDGPLWATVAAVVVSGVVSGFFAASMALAADSSHVYTWFAGISTAAGLLGVHGAMSVAAGHLVAVGHGGTRHGMTHNLIQDAILVLLLYVIVLVIPATTLLHLPPSLGFWARFVATFAIVGPFLTYFLGPYKWQLETNLGHVRREIASRSEIKAQTMSAVGRQRGTLRRNRVILLAARGKLSGPPQHRFLRILHAHVRNQNGISNALLGVSLVGFLVLLGGQTTAALAYLRGDQDLKPRG
ncbi:hypothetical protein [Amycolatopsis sp. CA-126428]|uniref:hypothetical protein n=1 Tax=Amycolatopsis sp. CA-126428 TaxID=2073158 RepID=UPI000CD2658D|nr:hypothetical protein [Amycolatopsis sp. CA-126428]